MSTRVRLRRLGATTLALLGALGFGPACGDATGSGTGGGPGAAAPSSSAQPEPVFDIDGFCEKAMGVGRPCQGDDAVLEGNKIGYCATLLREARDARRVHFDRAAAAACLAEIPKASPSLPERRTLRHLGERVPACRAVAVGEVPRGAECARTMECAPGLVCVGARCATPGAAGDACTVVKEDGSPFARSSCEPALRCVAGKCAAGAAAGGKCATSEACAPELRCRGGTCAPGHPLEAGAACEGTEDCASGHYCGGKPPKCTPKQQAGEACAATDSCLGNCNRQVDPARSRCVAYCGSG
ncbi:MAG: hypothetical protein IT373_14445 [Polyangiaceae bacterium]|nr:hypothetical protein [Polyangiaceae bacterium]